MTIKRPVLEIPLRMPATIDIMSATRELRMTNLINSTNHLLGAAKFLSAVWPVAKVCDGLSSGLQLAMRENVMNRSYGLLD
jgi:hypothetical protein